MKKIIYLTLLLVITIMLFSECSNNKKEIPANETYNGETADLQKAVVKNRKEKNDYIVTRIKPGNNLYKDGTYSGEAWGKESKIKVTVLVKENKIFDIIVDFQKETQGYSDDAIREIPRRITAKNSPEVDAVSGVTETSDGIRKAVGNALRGAVIK